MHLVEGQPFEPNADGNKVLGALLHYEEDREFREPETCEMTARVEPSNFDTLLGAIQIGRFPKEVIVGVRGLTQSWEPDGSGKVWDIHATRHAPIAELSFRIPLTRDLIDSRDSDNVGARELPAFAADVHSLQHDFSQQMTSLKRTVQIAAIALGALAILLWFFSH